MNILVCIKQVPDPESMIRINEKTGWIEEGRDMTYRMNRYDEYALEEAVLIRERYPETVIDAVSVGPDRVRSSIIKSLEKGAGNGIHLRDERNCLTAEETASCIASFARRRDYDLIFCGVMSEDLMQCQVGPMIAALNTIPCAVSVLREELDYAEGAVTVECELEGGVHETMRLTLPCLLTMQSGINRPRYPSLSNVLRAKSADIATVTIEDLCAGQALERVLYLAYPDRSAKGTVLDGTADEKAERLLSIFHEKSVL